MASKSSQSKKSTQRKLTAILSADVVGYSRRVASYLYVADTYPEQQKVIEAHGFKFYRSDFRADLGATFHERQFKTIGEDFLALYELV